jgi:hypothetical protein
MYIRYCPSSTAFFDIRRLLSGTYRVTVSQPCVAPADTPSMARRSRRQTLDSITFSITLTAGDLTRWQSAADRRGITLEQLVALAVERVIGAGS